jgi:hypothetical protein
LYVVHGFVKDRVSFCNAQFHLQSISLN